MRRRLRRFDALVLVLALADKFTLALGGFVAFHDTTVRYDSNSLGRGTTLDLENLLALDNREIILRASLV